MSEENRWWGALGLTPPEESGAEAREPAEPADVTDIGAEVQEQTNSAEASDTGANVQEPAEPATQEMQKQETEVPDEKQTPEERRKQAELRRERERQQFERQIREEEAQKTNEAVRHVLQAIGLKNEDGTLIETMEDFEAHLAQQRSQRVRRELKQGTLTPEALREAVLEAPEVKEVLQQAQTARNAAQAAQRKANQASFAANMQQEIAKIQKLDPSIRSTDDIIRMDTGTEYARLIRTGLSPSEAFRLANFDAIRDRDRAAAEQAARNAAAGKNHVQGTPTGGRQALRAPEDYKQNMRRFVRGITDEEIERSYRKYHSDHQT